MFKVQLTANISAGKYFFDIMHFFSELSETRKCFIVISFNFSLQYASINQV